MSVLFRTENNIDKRFNEYIRDNGLNNPLDNTTKIVYINSNKFPKPLLKSNWKPNTVLCMGSYRLNEKVNDYINAFDLVIHYDDQITSFNRTKVQTL